MRKIVTVRYERERERGREGGKESKEPAVSAPEASIEPAEGDELR